MSGSDHASKSGKESDSSFGSIFTKEGASVKLKVPDYQRAYSWEEKQVALFLSDLKDYVATGRPYYFGHYIVENRGNSWEIVDGQQRISTFVLFLVVCRHHQPFPLPESAESLVERFSTVSYDKDAFRTIVAGLGGYLARHEPFDPKHPPASEFLRAAFALPTDLSRSQRLLILALLQMDRAFRRGEMDRDKIPAYTAVVMKAHASRHLTCDKSVAVNVFEMHNTRGVPLTTLEVLKAVLMKAVYDHGGTLEECGKHVEAIQAGFGEIYRMEELLAERSFRGKMTAEQLLHHHLRVVDDGTKMEKRDFQTPAADSKGEDLVEYVRKRIREKAPEDSEASRDSKVVKYALELTRELAVSMKIVSQHLWEWDKDCGLVGDVLILEPWLSLQFFLLTCRRLEKTKGAADGRLGDESMKMWERLLFTRDFHDSYYRLRYRDDFELLFATMGSDEDHISKLLQHYLENGFRDQTHDLQALVGKYLEKIKASILNNAFGSPWRAKLNYAIYKYEVSRTVNLRNVMKGSISVEHILPQSWDEAWLDGHQDGEGFAENELQELRIKIDGFINGLGNLLILTPVENTSVGNNHPAKKIYRSTGGSYQEHDQNRERWKSSAEWPILIQERGEKMFQFMVSTLINAPIQPVEEPIEALWEYCTAENRLVPMPDVWNKLYGMLRNTIQRPSGGWEPPLPLILAAWHHSLPIEKQLRFKVHLEWADKQGQLEEVAAFLRSLPENQWCHLGEV